MILQMFSIRDLKAGVFGAPFVSANPSVAKRLVGDMLAEGRTIQARHPEDFDLVALGTYNDVTGQIQVLEIPEVQCGLHSLTVEPTK